MYMSLRVCARVPRVRAFVRACVSVCVPACVCPCVLSLPTTPQPPLGSGGGGREETVKDIVPSPDQQGSGFCELKPFLFLSFFNLGGCVSCLRACFGAG